ITGNPRFDTLLPELRDFYGFKAARIQEQHGRFLLVNTNFSIASHYNNEKDVVARIVKKTCREDESQSAYYRRLADYKCRLMKRLQSLLQQLAKADVVDRIIIRPHPVENHDVWREWAAGMPNVEVRYEGNANVWMLAAEAVLHSGCTTGIEGLLLARPVFSLLPHPDITFLNQSDPPTHHI